MSSTEDARLVDIGFTRFQSERKGRIAAVIALARWSALRALGARRPWTAKLVPVALVLLAFGPALVVLGARAIVGDRVELPEILPYADYYGVIGVVVLVFVAMTTPELLCPDRRDRVLDLYLATAVSPFEYVLGKFLAAVVPLLCLTFVPQFTLFVGNAIFDEDAFGYLRDNADIAPKIVVSGLLLAIYFALLGLAISSLTDRRPFAVGGFLGLMLVSAGVAGSLVGLYEEKPEFEVIALGINPIALVQHVFGNLDDEGVAWTWRFGSWLVVVLVSSFVLWRRYRRAAG